MAIDIIVEALNRRLTACRTSRELGRPAFSETYEELVFDLIKQPEQLAAAAEALESRTVETLAQLGVLTIDREAIRRAYVEQVVGDALEKAVLAKQGERRNLARSERPRPASERFAFRHKCWDCMWIWFADVPDPVCSRCGNRRSVWTEAMGKGPIAGPHSESMPAAHFVNERVTGKRLRAVIRRLESALGSNGGALLRIFRADREVTLEGFLASPLVRQKLTRVASEKEPTYPTKWSIHLPSNLVRLPHSYRSIDRAEYQARIADLLQWGIYTPGLDRQQAEALAGAFVNTLFGIGTRSVDCYDILNKCLPETFQCTPHYGFAHFEIGCDRATRRWWTLAVAGTD